MNEYDYINFLIATQKAYSCTEAERVQPVSERSLAHDAITATVAWSHRRRCYAGAKRSSRWVWTGILVITITLDKFYAEKIELVTRHWSGKHGRSSKASIWLRCCGLQGIALSRLDYRFYEKMMGAEARMTILPWCSKTAKERGFAPRCVVFDSCTAADNLKLIRRHGWLWLTRLKTQSSC